MIYFTADLHLNHANIIKYCNRPFQSVEDMDAILIRNWNSTVRDCDTVYLLGDLAYKAGPSIEALLDQLNGIIVLIKGNHETPHPTKGQAINFDRFKYVHDYLELEIDGQQLILFHYPIENWNNKWKGSYHLCGHSHGKAKKMKGRLDVGVDTHDFRPWSWKEIKEHFNPKLSDAF
jgi:calcineurin-like phosphoesterase family protein